MRSLIKLTVICMAVVISHSTFAAGTAKDIQAIKGLAKRVLSVKSKYFIFRTLKSEDDRFELESRAGKIIIRGNNANSMAVGLNHYLKYYCKTNVSWFAHNKHTLPRRLPVVKKKVVKDARCENRFFLNYCTFGYTMPWWKWNDWERLIDWMALNGVTMPLAITGQEAIWYRVWKKHGLTDEQIRSYFTGPAHLPWHRMANIDKWQGGLPHSWLDTQLELQKKIVKRERELNMTPVLPAFAGHVPADLKTIYTDSNIKSLGGWGGFNKQYRSSFLDPLDPLFMQIQKDFMMIQTELFGTDHIYGTDPFNEVKPPSWEPEYLATVGKTIYESMAAVDPKAQWIQMGWIFYFERKHWTPERVKAMVRSVPQDKMIILDYHCESREVWRMSDKFHGQPYIWCYLGNFGGNTMLAGNLQTVNKRLEDTFKDGGDNLWGVGSTLEALDVNPVMYEFLFEKVWEDSITDLNEWMRTYAAAQSGVDDNSVAEAWQLLEEKVYTRSSGLGQGTLTNTRPSLDKNTHWVRPNIHYKNKALLEAWGKMLKSSQTSHNAYQHDIVNIGRQVLGNYFSPLRSQFTEAYKAKDQKKVQEIGNRMLSLIDDMDRLLATRTDFLLGKWLNDAKDIAVDEAEEKYYETNARTIISTWGPKGIFLTDYANRGWAGLMKTYYRPRWEMFVTDVLASMESGEEFDQKAFDKKSKDFEGEWTESNQQFSSKPTGDSVKIARELYKKYAEDIAAVE